MSHLKLDLTNPDGLKDRLRWGPTDRIVCTSAGLGGNAGPRSSVDGSIETTTPIGVANWWLPTESLRIRARIDRTPADVDPSRVPPQIYVRYGPNSTHWSTWEALPVDRTVFSELYP